MIHPRISSTVALSFALVGCATGATTQQLRARAAFDLACAQDQLTLVDIDDKTTGVQGCGQRATYVEMCKPCANGYLGCECTWLLNGDTAPAASATPPESPAAPTDASSTGPG